MMRYYGLAGEQQVTARHSTSQHITPRHLLQVVAERQEDGPLDDHDQPSSADAVAIVCRKQNTIDKNSVRFPFSLFRQ